MIKVVVKNLNDVETHIGFFSDNSEADAWIEKYVLKNVWGKPSRWIAENLLESENENILLSDENKIESGVKLYHFPASYTITKIDISEEVNLRNQKILRAKKRAFGEHMIDKISALNDSKGLNASQVDALMGNELISSLREHLWVGNIDTFVTKLSNSDVSLFFTNQEKDSVISECEQFLLNI